jgi:predicted ATPase
MKKLKITLILVSFVLISSCGFKPINLEDSKTINFKNINISGDKKISYNLRNNILLISNNDSKNVQDINIKIQKRKTSKIKDKTGKVTRYNLSISAKLKLTNLKDSSIVEKTFSQNEDFYVSAVHIDTINNEENAVKNIIDQLSTDIINFITLRMRKR